VAEEILEENTIVERTVSPDDKTTGKKKLSACGDCRWDKRASGQRYGSTSGCSVLIGGCLLQLVLDIEAMSTSCPKCHQDLPNPEELCPENVECSVKGMEAIGSSQIVQTLFEKYHCYICEYVGDDDSSTKCILRRSWQDEISALLREEKYLP
jgi:hypothetical protein